MPVLEVSTKVSLRLLVSTEALFTASEAILNSFAYGCSDDTMVSFVLLARKDIHNAVIAVSARRTVLALTITLSPEVRARETTSNNKRLSYWCVAL